VRRPGRPAAFLAFLALWLVACGSVVPAGTPHDASAMFRPASMIVEPESAAPGQEVELRFPDEMTRGVWFVLEQEVGEAWVHRYDLTSDGPGPDWMITWHVAGQEGFAVDDIGVGGPGPDTVRIPDVAEPGSWRICTANAAENVCVRIGIVDG
jgi:hypothetical protein